LVNCPFQTEVREVKYYKNEFNRTGRQQVLYTADNFQDPVYTPAAGQSATGNSKFGWTLAPTSDAKFNAKIWFVSDLVIADRYNYSYCQIHYQYYTPLKLDSHEKQRD